jgi:hypothetical protein
MQPDYDGVAIGRDPVDLQLGKFARKTFEVFRRERPPWGSEALGENFFRR